jgi:DNA-binding transcriptional ArsR family regulator
MRPCGSGHRRDGGRGLTRSREARAGNVFAALSDPTRRRIVRWLVESGPATATELARRLPITRQAVAKHLAAMETAGLVDRSKRGREVRYRLRPEPLAHATEWMAAISRRWDQRWARK